MKPLMLVLALAGYALAARTPTQVINDLAIAADFVEAPSDYCTKVVRQYKAKMYPVIKSSGFKFAGAYTFKLTTTESILKSVLDLRTRENNMQAQTPWKADYGLGRAYIADSNLKAGYFVHIHQPGEFGDTSICIVVTVPASK